jgi:hypothetical protein
LVFTGFLSAGYFPPFCSPSTTLDAIASAISDVLQTQIDVICNSFYGKCLWQES